MNLRKKDIKDLINLLEEFSWLTSKYKPSQLRNLRDVLMDDLERERERDLTLINEQKTNTSYLIGVLPSFFQDRNFFEKNSDLNKFAEFLNIYIPNFEKKSRYEIIGVMLCYISDMDEKSLDDLVNAIDVMMKNDHIKQRIKELQSKNSDIYNWNNVIRMLSHKQE